MRLDVPVTLITEGVRVYDHTTGDYILSPEVKEVVYANVSDTGTEQQTLIFGRLEQSALTVRLQDYPHEFDSLEIYEKPYKVQMRKKFRGKTVLYVSEKA